MKTGSIRATIDQCQSILLGSAYMASRKLSKIQCKVFRLQNGLSDYYPSEKSLINIDFLLLSEDYDWDTSDATIIKFLQAVFKNRMTDSAFNPFLQISPEIESEVESIMTAQEEYEYELQV